MPASERVRALASQGARERASVSAQAPELVSAAVQALELAQVPEWEWESVRARVPVTALEWAPASAERFWRDGPSGCC